MRFCFLVGDIKGQQPTFAGIYPGWAAHRRKHEVAFASVNEISLLDDNQVLAATTRVRPGDYARPADYWRALNAEDAIREESSLSGFDVVFVRFNPFREGEGSPHSPIIDVCSRLRLGGTLVVNEPEGLRRAGGRMYLSDLPPEIRARTLVSRSADRIKEFLRALDGPAVLKPLSPTGAENVFYVRRRQVANLNQIITAIIKTGYAVAQEYLPEAEQGEKRLLFVGGKPVRIGRQVAIYKRLPALRPARNGNGAGGGRNGSNRKCEFGPTEARLCEILRPKLVADGLYFVSADIVGGRVFELNVFTPGGMHSMKEIYGADVASFVVQDLERIA